MTPAPGSFEAVVDGLVALGEEIKTAVAATDLQPIVAAHRWGNATAHKHPATWLTLDRAITELPNDGCNVVDAVTITLKISTMPRVNAGLDMADLEKLVDLAIPLVDRCLRDVWDRMGLRRFATRTGFTMDTEKIGEGYITVLEIPMSLPWGHNTPPAE